LTTLPTAFVRFILTAKHSALLRRLTVGFAVTLHPRRLVCAFGSFATGGEVVFCPLKFIGGRPYLKMFQFLVSNLPQYKRWP